MQARCLEIKWGQKCNPNFHNILIKIHRKLLSEPVLEEIFLKFKGELQIEILLNEVRITEEEKNNLFIK